MATKTSSPYIPSFLISAVDGNRPLQLSFSDIRDSNIINTSSFLYDAQDAPLKTTQQLNVDWSQFENHTFFMSAEAKVNLAFDQIINGYPFDGTRAETEIFFEKLSGFDKWVFDNFPKFHGQLMFTGTVLSEVGPTLGTYIVVKDNAGSLYPELSKTKTGASVLNPKGSSMSIEMQLYIPNIHTSGTQVICQKLSGSAQGFSLYLTANTSTSSVEARFSVVSGSVSLTVPAVLDKGQFNHICVTLNREQGVHYLEFFKSAASVAITKSQYRINDFDIDASDFIIGSGTQINLGATTVLPLQTLSGTIDEFRVFHSIRSIEQQKLFAPKSIFAETDLKLYYHFNEPPPPLTTTGSDQIDAIVIDSSGNSLHSVVSNFSSYVDVDTDLVVTGSKLRQDASLDSLNPVIYEKEETVPVLFPAYPDIVDLNTLLLISASTYDLANPNLITRLIPQHYLQDGTLYDGFSVPEGDANSAYGGTGLPGQGQMGNVQLLLSLLYIWARFFDEMKLYVDAFSTLKTVDYDSNVSMPNNFLRDLVKQYGFYLPPLFNDSTTEQFVHGENIEIDTIGNSSTSLRSVQNELLRRILINIPDVLRSKGTQHSIKAFLRAVGIDPENSVRLREFGGPTTRQLSFSRENKREVGTMVEFITSSYVQSAYLSSSRYEPGFPVAAGAFVNKVTFPPYGVSNNPNDGLLTSGSWTVETLIKYTPQKLRSMTSATQSLVRLCATGSMSGTLGCLANLLIISSSVESRLVLYARPGSDSSDPLLQMQLILPAGALFDGDKWNVSFGCSRNDAIGSRVSSSYFLRAAAQTPGDASELQYFKSTSSFFNELRVTGSNALRVVNSVFNSSGAFLAVGENIPINSGAGTGYLFLNNSSTVNSEARTVAFTGLQSNLRFWSKALTEIEWKEHVRNHKSIGVVDPLINYNFVKTRSGSFEKLRVDSFDKQITRRANATASLGPTGAITFLDFSLNGLHLQGTGFPIDADCVKGEIFDINYISPYFDEAATNEKVRIRSYLNQDLVDASPWAGVAPVYEMVKSERPTDDTRFSIEFSLIDALNRDIITMFATLDAIDNAIGSPELLYSPDYPNLETLRNIYFNRISERLNFKGFFEFFRWFDTSIGTFIQQLIPMKTNFKGTNFVIESHMLERHKLEYLSTDIYLGEANRNRIKNNLLLQQITGIIRKY